MSHHSNRKESYLTSSIPSFNKSQEQRRLDSLNLQKERRQNAFDLARSSGGSLGLLGELNLMSDSSSDEESILSTSTSTTASSTSSAPSLSSGHSKKKRKSNRSKHFPWAKDLLMYAETLQLSEGFLPERLESEWSAVVAPKGKRVVIVSGFSTGANTVLLARASGRALERRSTILPYDCILDGLYDSEINTIWILDLIKWKGVYYVDFDFTFRSFFLSSKLSELPLQPFSPLPLAPYPSTRTNLKSKSRPPLLVLPTPRHSSPLTPSLLLNLMSTISIPTTLSISVLLNSSTSSIPEKTILNLPFSTTGFLLFLNEAVYHSGGTTLSVWIPNEVTSGREEMEGLGRMERLVTAWEERGGTSRDVEQEMVGVKEEKEEGEEEMDLED